MWRWSPSWKLWVRNSPVFSTYVEVILCSNVICPVMWGFLHVCGGDPNVGRAKMEAKLFSPRMWRWSYQKALFKLKCYVFSTYVEVILISLYLPSKSLCFLHVCGGDPKTIPDLSFDSKFSPRMWRWSQCHSHRLNELAVFSTYVEVIPIAPISWYLGGCFLHVCGGDPR